MSRLNIERQEKLEPLRMTVAIEKITALGYEITFQDETRLEFIFRGHRIKYFPYSGWATGLTIKDGRGLSKLLKQINL